MEAQLVFPNSGNLISCLKKSQGPGLKNCIKKSSITIDAHPIQEIKIKTENTSLKVSMNKQSTNNITLAEIKKHIAEDSFKSVYSYSQAVISLNIKKLGVFIANTTTNTAIPNRTTKLISKLLNLFESHTTINSYEKESALSEETVILILSQ